MPSTTNYKRGDLILVPFPFTDLSSTKQRPALVISSDAFNSARGDLLLAAITSQIPPTLADDELSIPPNELAAYGLPKPSLIKLTKLVTLHQMLVVKRLGSLPPTTLNQVLAGIRQTLQ